MEHEISLFGDIDVYVQKDRLPNSNDYLDKDISTDKDVEIDITYGLAPGIWYIGVYGYWDADFTLTVNLELNCPVQCVHGTCGNNNQCVCDTNYVKTDWDQSCSIYDQQISSGTLYTSTVIKDEWNYYHINVPNSQSILEIVVTELSSANQNVDVYVQKNQYPYFDNFMAINATLSSQTTIHLNNDLESGIYYIGVYSFGESGQISIKATITAASCENVCTKRGNCVNGACQCNNNIYTGNSCEIVEDMYIEQNYSGYVSTSNWNYYELKSSTQNDLVVSVHQQNEGDCDLYISELTKPTRNNYQYADLGIKSDFNITIEQPGVDTYWIGVYGWSTCQYTLFVDEPSTCSCLNNQVGFCLPNSDYCICNFGNQGPDCSTTSTHINSGDVKSSTVEQNEWKYFTFNTSSAVAVVTLEETNTQGLASLYVETEGFPNLQYYSYLSSVPNNDFHELHIVFDAPANRVLYIGVYGNFFNIDRVSVDFQLTAWSPELNK
eukprot:TRINITY_DN3895_c0_g1_i2.p1 TRINITY_DN3895_c0_g1~~TRINITY_DN3895_c0_g1_i2.p1  ORF type:complete len:494 (-),score=119.57 TRINITY_DN3895_c0_g1_i2:84-1565(-)